MNEDKNIYNGFISGNVLKIIACITMLVDHIGWILLPEVIVFRAIGRISMPLFAFTFGEGCRYTRSKGRHFALVFGMGIVTSAAMSFVMGEIYGNILITFSFSALIIYSIDGLKKYAFSHNRKGTALCSLALAASLALATAACCFAPAEIDYGIAGVTLPVCVRLFDFRSFGADGALASLYHPATVFLLFFVNLLALSAVYGILQFLCILSMLPIAAYSGRRGKFKLKGLFYTFYPAHLLLIAGIYLILNPAYLSGLF